MYCSNRPSAVFLDYQDGLFPSSFVFSFPPYCHAPLWRDYVKSYVFNMFLFTPTISGFFSLIRSLNSSSCPSPFVYITLPFLPSLCVCVCVCWCLCMCVCRCSYAFYVCVHIRIWECGYYISPIPSLFFQDGQIEGFLFSLHDSFHSVLVPSSLHSVGPFPIVYVFPLSEMTRILKHTHGLGRTYVVYISLNI